MTFFMEKICRFAFLLILLAFIPQAKGEEIACDSVPKGKYIYVPDSLQNDVMKLLMGNSKVVDDESKFDFSEKVLWKGDTVPMKLRTRNLGRFDRGLFNYLFIPKGLSLIHI